MNHLNVEESSEHYGRATTIPVILRHCKHLKHLGMKVNVLQDDAIDALIDGFDSSLDRFLVSLDLNGNDFSSVGIEKLSAFLLNPAKRPVIREL